MRAGCAVAPGAPSCGSQISQRLVGRAKPLLATQEKYASMYGSKAPTGRKPSMMSPRMKKRGSFGPVARGSGVVVV
jgi:hypothetical protein